MTMIGIVAYNKLKPEDTEYHPTEVTRTGHYYYHHGFKTRAKIKEGWFPYYEYTTNSIGCKASSKKRVKKNAKKRRVVFIGDSFTEGIGVLHENTFVGHIETHYPEMEILNGGVASYSPKLDYLKAKYFLEALKLKIDKIIVYTGPDDIYDEFVYCPVRFHEVRNFQRKHRRDANTDIRSVSVPDSLICTNDIIQTDLRGSESTTQYMLSYASDEEVFQKWGRDGGKLATMHMKLLHDLCLKHDVDLAIAIYTWPQLMKKDIHLDNNYTRLWRDFASNHDITLIDHYR